MKKDLIGNLLSLNILVLAICLTGCRENSFRIDGEITGADNQPLLLQRPGFNGLWVTVDSTRTSSDGNFSFSFEAPENPEIFRLMLQDKPLYFPIDSTEHLSLKTSLKDFGSDYTLDGSDNARKIRDFDIKLIKAYSQSSEAVAGVKKEAVTNIILPSKGNILAYYVLTKNYGTTPLFSTDDPADAGIFGAVATSFAQYRPNDPRTKMLENLALEARRNRNRSLGRKSVIEAGEVAAIDINLADAKGEKTPLSSLLGKGKAVAVIFSPLNESDSPEVNRRIAALYRKYEAKVEFYQVCPDVDILAWREAAANLPWIVVNDPDGVDSPNIRSYNVRRLPAFFIYSPAGELTSSAADITDFDRKLSAL